VVSDAMHGAVCKRWDSDPIIFRFRFVQSDFGFLIVIEDLVQKDCTEYSVVVYSLYLKVILPPDSWVRRRTTF
jgi:hypothetical protein